MLYEFLDIDKTAKATLYEQIYRCIKEAIENGTLIKGDKLPSIRGLSCDLNISRTTVESAYDQLCAEGYIVNKPRCGYFIEANPDISSNIKVPQPTAPDLNDIRRMAIKYDFSSSAVDAEYIDIKFWKRCVKDVLDKHYIISSYGCTQGEEALRTALCNYSRNVRGVDASSDRIVVGAGTQTLLSILLGLCGEYGKDVAIERGFFPQGEQIFSDFGYSFTELTADKNGIILDGVKSRVLFINSSGSIRGSAPLPINKRHELIRWAEKNNAIIIEDDFNGELRYTSKPVSALQGMCSDRVVYIGSFSKLLLPSVRISYLVLPKKLAQLYRERCRNYNQTSSKVEQLAFASYISSGRLERQLRKLRKLYSEKSKLLEGCLEELFGENAVIEVIETALCVRMKLKTPYTLAYLVKKAEDSGIELGKCREKNGLKYFYLSFAGIPFNEIPLACKKLREIWG